MSESSFESPRKVLIASANPLFARGLRKLASEHWSGRSVEMRMAKSMAEAFEILESWQPNLVIVDYDDRNIPRAEFLSHFIAGDRPMQVMLVSLQESGEVVVYDRRTLTPAQAEDWFDLPWERSSAPASAPVPAAAAVTAQVNAPANAQEAAAAPAKAVSPISTSTRSGGMKHYVIAGIITAVMTLITGLFLTNIGLMPIVASNEALPVDAMINLQAWLIAFLFSLITVFILYSVIVFRRRPGSTGAVAHFENSNVLEVTWTLIPLITVIILAFIGAKDLAAIRKEDPGALNVNVTAFQWGWIFEYPDAGVTSNILYLPIDKQVHFSMTSRDVIHSFWVPEFRIKQDVLPGKNLVKDLRITPNRLGDYKVRCAEMCGGAHAYMESPVKVVSQGDFDTWLAGQSTASAGAAQQQPAERGAKLVEAQGCLACHSIDGSAKLGPTWKGLAGKTENLIDGGQVTVDDAYLHSSIVDPNAQIVQGFSPLMPPYKDALSEEQITDMVEFIKTLK